jgi:hypothetical protein
MNDNVSKVGDAMKEMNKQSMLFEINTLKRDLQQLKNEWRKEKKHCLYESDEDGEYYKSSIESIEDSIREMKGHLDKLDKE